MKNKLSIHKGKLLAWLFIILAIILTNFSDSILSKYLDQPPPQEFINVVISKPDQEKAATDIDLDKMDTIEIEAQANINDIEETDNKPISPPIKKVNKFRQELIIVHYIISKFLQNLDYSQELTLLNRSLLPQNINELLDLMEDYNKKYLASTMNKNIISKNNHLDRIIGRFIKIEKQPSEKIEQKTLYNNIKKDLHILEDYFYSEQSIDRLSAS